MDNCHLDAFALKSFLTEHSVYQHFLELLIAATSSELGYLHLYDPKKQEIKLNVWSENTLELCRTHSDAHYPLQKAGNWADSLRDGCAVIHNQYDSDLSYSGFPDDHPPLYRHLSVPVKEDGSIVAILGVGNSKRDYTSESIFLVETALKKGWDLVNSHLYKINKRRLVEEEHFSSETVESVLINMLTAVGKALEIRDEYTASHQQNVAIVSVCIGEQLLLTDKEKLGLKLGALIHDIGKITIPSQILNKTGKLYPVEYDLLKMHAGNGASIFEGIRFPWPIYDMILHHHERLDGSGYPDGLKGDQICLEAKIIAVADTLDAIAADRPYRRSRGLDQAVEEIKRGRNRLFDPYVVDALLDVYEQKGALQELYLASH